MPTRAQLEAEAYRRGVMPPERRALYEEGVRRGIVKDAYAKGRVEARSGKQRGLGEVATTFNEYFPLADEAAAGLGAFVNTATTPGRGKPFGERLKRNYGMARDYQAGINDGFRDRAPNLFNTTVGLSYATQAIPAMASGGATATPQAQNVFMRTAAGTARNATVGASYSAANAAAGRGTVQERTQAANEAILPGAVAGVAVPALLATPGAVKSTLKPVTDTVVRTTKRAANNLATRAGAKPFLDPRQEALSRLSETLKADGFTPQEVVNLTREWQRVGGPSPAFMDVIAQGGRGQQTMALIRGSAMSGPARTTATEYGSRVAADLQDDAIARTRQLTPERRPAAAVAQELRTNRGNLATQQYREPYQTQVQVGDDVAEVLTDAPGKAALRQARADALERRDMSRVQEIDSLLAAEPVPANPFEWYRPTPPTVSGATLDRTQIAFRERGDKLARASNNARAGGARDRRAVINRQLDSVPQLNEARGAYRDASRQIEGVENVGPGVLNTPADEYAAQVAALGNGAQPATQVGAARALEDAIGRPAEGSTGVLNRIGTATNTGRNLEATFGPQQAGDYRQAVRQITQRVQNARFINPNTGSQTAGRLADESLVEGIPQGKMSFAIWAINKVKRGATLSEAERQAIVEIATSRGMTPEQFAAEVAALPAPAPRLPPPDYGRTNIFAIPQSQENRR